MDLSKLPKLSQNDQPPPPRPPEPRPVTPMPSAGPEAWLSIAIGVIVLLIFPRFLQWFSSRLFGTNFNEFILPDGTVVPYQHVHEFLADLASITFGFMMIIDGIALALANRSLTWAAFFITLAITVFNLIYVVATYSQGLAIVSAIAVVYGVYTSWQQWKMLQLSSDRA